MCDIVMFSGIISVPVNFKMGLSKSTYSKALDAKVSSYSKVKHIFMEQVNIPEEVTNLPFNFKRRIEFVLQDT